MQYHHYLQLFEPHQRILAVWKFRTMREDNNKIILASISCLTINTMSAPKCANNKQNINEVLIYFVLLLNPCSKTLALFNLPIIIRRMLLTFVMVK